MHLRFPVQSNYCAKPRQRSHRIFRLAASGSLILINFVICGSVTYLELHLELHFELRPQFLTKTIDRLTFLIRRV